MTMAGAEAGNSPGTSERRPSRALPPHRFGSDGPRADGSLVFLDGELVPTAAAALDAHIKSLNYLNIVRSRIEAHGRGADESILLDERSRLADGSIYNVVTVHGGTLKPPAEGCLEGVTLDTLFRLATALGLKARRDDVWPYDLRNADDVLFASTAVGVVAVTAIDGRPECTGMPGPAFAALDRAYSGALDDPGFATPVPGLRPQSQPAIAGATR